MGVPGRLGLGLHGQVGAVQSHLHLRKLRIGLYLDAQMVHALLLGAIGDREVHAWIVQRPLRIVVPDDGRFSGKERRVLADAGRQVGHADMDVEALHGSGLSGDGTGGHRRTRIATTAVLREIAEQGIHGLESSHVDDRATLVAACQQTSAVQFLEVE